MESNKARMRIVFEELRTLRNNMSVNEFQETVSELILEDFNRFDAIGRAGFIAIEEYKKRLDTLKGFE